MDEIEQLLKQVNDADVDVRWKAIVALENVNDRRALEPLLECLHDPEPSVRARAAQALHMPYDKRILPGLLPLLTDKEAEVRAAACYGLGSRYYRDALDGLCARLHDVSEEVRAAAAIALRRYPSYRALNAVLAARADEDSSVRESVAETLGTFHVPHVIRPLIKFARRDPELPVRLAAIESLRYVVHPHEKTFWDILYHKKDAVEVLLDLLEEDDEEVAMAAYESLGYIGDTRAVNTLVAHLCDWDRAFGRRLWAVSALGDLDDRRATPILIAALQDPEPLMRPSAARALGRLGDPAALPALEALAEDEADELGKAAVKAVERIRYEMSWEDFDRVVAYLKEGDFSEQERALEILEAYDTPQTWELIIEALNSSIEQDDVSLFFATSKLAAQYGRAEALPLFMRGWERWFPLNRVELIQEIEQATDYIRRKLQGEELEPYESIVDDAEDYELDDEEEALDISALDDDDEEEIEDADEDIIEYDEFDEDEEDNTADEEDDGDEDAGTRV